MDWNSVEHLVCKKAARLGRSRVDSKGGSLAARTAHHSVALMVSWKAARWGGETAGQRDAHSVGWWVANWADRMA